MCEARCVVLQLFWLGPRGLSFLRFGNCLRMARVKLGARNPMNWRGRGWLGRTLSHTQRSWCHQWLRSPVSRCPGNKRSASPERAKKKRKVVLVKAQQAGPTGGRFVDPESAKSHEVTSCGSGFLLAQTQGHPVFRG